jgi:hypothetical protein
MNEKYRTINKKYIKSNKCIKMKKDWKIFLNVKDGLNVKQWYS